MDDHVSQTFIWIYLFLTAFGRMSVTRITNDEHSFAASEARCDTLSDYEIINQYMHAA